MIVDELIALLGYRLTGQGDLAKFNAGIKGAERNLAAFAATAARYGAIVGTVVATGAVFLGKSVLKVGSQFEGYNIQLETLLGSQEKAKEALNWIQDFAKSTPLEIADVTEAYASLVNFGIDPTNGSLQALTDAMAGSGKGTDTLRRLTLALGQAWVKQKLQGQEILQLTEAGIPVWDMLAKSTGKSVMELQKLSEQGKLGRKEIQMLIDAIGKKYLGASAKFAKSFAGITSNLSDNWTQFLKRIADAGFFPFMEERLQSLLDNVNRWAADGTLDRWAKNISDAFIFVAGVVEFLVNRIIRNGAIIAEWLGKLDPNIVKAFGAAILLLAAYLFPLTWAFGLVILAIDDFLGYLDDADSKFGDFVAWIQEMTGASEGLAQALAAVAAALMLIAGIKVFSLLKGLAGFGAGVLGGAKGELTKGVTGRSGGILGLLGRLSPFLAMMALPGSAPKDQTEKEFEFTDDYLDQVTEFKGWDKKGPSTRGGRRRKTTDRRRGSFVTEPVAETPESVNQDGGGFASILANMDAHIQKLAAGAKPGAIVTDNSQDNRSYPVTVNSSVVQNITEAAAASAAGAATSAAVGQAAVAAASRIEKEPAF